MEITYIIVGGVIIVSFLSAGFDYLSKKSKRADMETVNIMSSFENRLKTLETKLEERDDKILHLEEDLSFFRNLIEKKQ
jgi:hypothetical protein